MPVIPMTKGPPPNAVMPSEVNQLMALAEMHKQGRFDVAQTDPGKVYDVPMSNNALKMEERVKPNSQYEQTIDKFIKDKGLQENDRMRVKHPDEDEPRIYKYLGPNSGGRKDWMELPKSKETS